MIKSSCCWFNGDGVGGIQESIDAEPCDGFGGYGDGWAFGGANGDSTLFRNYFGEYFGADLYTEEQ